MEIKYKLLICLINKGGKIKPYLYLITSYILKFCTLQLDLAILLNVGLYDFFTGQTLPNQTVGDSSIISFFN